MNAAIRARFGNEAAAESPGESSTAVHARNHSENKAGRPAHRAAPLLFLRGKFFRIAALALVSLPPGRADGNQLLVRGAERLEIAIAAMEAGPGAKISGAHLVRHFCDGLFCFCERFRVAHCGRWLVAREIVED